MEPFELNKHGRIVFPSTFFPDLDFSTMQSLEQLDAVVRRDFDAKAPTGTDIVANIEKGSYRNRYELMRDMALNLFWANRFAISMYDVRPTRWADVPRKRDDIFLPSLSPWRNGAAKVAAVASAYESLPPSWDAEVEDGIFEVLFDVFGLRRNHATKMSAVVPTVAELLSDPHNKTLRLDGFDPDFPRYSHAEILDCNEDVAELEALRRWTMVLHNQAPWDRKQAQLVEVGELRDDDFVAVFHPRDRAVHQFITRLSAGETHTAPAVPAREVKVVPPIRPYPAIDVRNDFAVWPRIEAIAAEHGDQVCTNNDLIRNSAYNWSPMAADEIAAKTGIEQRLYTSGSIEELALKAAESALAHAGVGAGEIGAVIVCTCTSSRLLPSLATWISAELGIEQTHASFDLVAACAGLPYGLAEATRILQTVRRPVLVVCVEKFSDKIGNIRPSRMIFGDGAAAIIIGVAPDGTKPDIEFIQTYASGPTSQVNSIIWPNPAFDNNITVYGPEVKALAGRYLGQMLDDIKTLPDPDGVAGSLLDSIELIIPHQANKTMVIELAAASGLTADQLYFNIEKVGNTSSASILLAIHDAVRDGAIDVPKRVFAPGFGAGAVAGYAVLRVDPAVVAPQRSAESAHGSSADSAPHAVPSPEDVALAFG
jgi:3-oxoacyl-[acyl-carrier-protein] synthase III